MRTLVVAFYGNPGRIEDFEFLDKQKKYLDETEIDIFCYGRPEKGGNLEKIVENIELMVSQRRASAVTVIAYSWGCYLASLWLEKTKLPVKSIVFVSPSLIAENPISKFIGLLVNLPLLGKQLLKKITPKLANEFINKSFLPASAPNCSTNDSLKYLFDYKIWKGAIHSKLQQQNKPLKRLEHIPADCIYILRGEQDHSSDWSKQHSILQNIIYNSDDINYRTINNAGHALLWTHPVQVRQCINEALNVSVLNNNALSKVGFMPKKSAQNNVVSYLKYHSEHNATNTALFWPLKKDVLNFDGDVQKKFRMESITFQDFYKLIQRLAQGLNNLGITKNDRVILFLPMSLEMYAAMFAIQYIGAIAVFLDSWARRNHLGCSAECVDPKAMISHQAAFSLIAEVPEFSNMKIKIITGEGDDTQYTARLESLFLTKPISPMVAVDADDTALVTFTTGSSGVPKGANRTHRFLCAQHNALKLVIPYFDTDVDIPAFPIFSLNNLASGVATILPAIDLAQPHDNDAAALVSQITHESVSCTTLSPSMLTNMSAYCLHKSSHLPSLRRVITGGAPISRDNVKEFKRIAPNTEIWILYGSTEVEPMAHIEAQEMLSIGEHSDPEIIDNGVNVGHIAQGLQYKFIKPTKSNITFDTLDWADIEVASGQVGEFIVTGDHVCENYYNNEAAFLRSKICDKTGTVWHRTGDLGRLDKNGYLWIVGRVHNMIDRAGHYFFPVAAEILLKRCDFIHKGAFLGLPDNLLGERAAVAVEFPQQNNNKEMYVKEIVRLFTKNNIALDSLYQVEQIPMDPRHHSKVEYSQLRELIIKQKSVDLLCQ